MKKKIIGWLLFFGVIIIFFNSLQIYFLTTKEINESYSKTFKNLEEFIKQDKTNENKWVKDKYMCWNFTKDFINNAFQEGFICFPYITEKHVKVFCEVKEGYYIIEPQTDEYISFSFRNPINYIKPSNN